MVEASNVLRRVGAHAVAPSRANAPRPASRSQARAPHVVIIVENMTVPPDRRVWQQAQALVSDGWRVTVVTPQIGSFTAPRERLDGVDIIRHPLPMQARRIAAYAIEYGAALFFESLALLEIGLDDIDVVQICNPPDFLFAPALVAKKFGHAKVVFDHHDLTPELVSQKMGASVFAPAFHGLARWAERRTFEIADRIISTNGAFRDLALERSSKDDHDVTVVFSGPRLHRLADARANPALRKGAEVLLLWVGVMGSQDGVDTLIKATAALRAMPGGDRFHLLIAGDGPEKTSLERLCTMLGLDDVVSFAGFLTGERLAEAFVTADIGVGSDPKSAFNDRLAMNKTMEYMAASLPIAMFDLDENARIAGDAALLARGNDPTALAAAMSTLIQNPAWRAAKGAAGRARFEAEFAWERQEETYKNVYRSLLADM